MAISPPFHHKIAESLFIKLCDFAFCQGGRKCSVIFARYSYPKKVRRTCFKFTTLAVSPNTFGEIYRVMLSHFIVHLQFDVYTFYQRKRPVERGPVKNRQKSSISVRTHLDFFDTCRTGQNTLKLPKSFTNYFVDTFPHLSRSTIQQFPGVTSIGSLPPRNLGKSRGPPQSPVEPLARRRRTPGETPQSPLRDPRRAL